MESDADNLVELDSDPEVMRFLSGGEPTPRDVVESVVLPRFLRFYERFNGLGYWAAVEKSTGEFVGWFGLRPHEDSPPDTLELSYRLRRSVWRKGYATEGARALIRKGFTELGMRRVQATTYEHNVASRRVMEKVSMTFERFYRPTPEELAATFTWVSASQEVWDGEDVIYALERSAWEQEEAARTVANPSL